METNKILREIRKSLKKEIEKQTPKPGSEEYYDELDGGNFAFGLKRALGIVNKVAKNAKKL